jgi:DNA-binding NarL/FixJ family response regulator
LLVDDHRLLRHGVRHIVEQTGAVVCEAATGEAALTALTSEFDLAIIDLALADMPGLDLVRRVHERHPRLPIIVLSLHAAEHLAQQAFKAGALAYLPKETAPADLIEAIKLARHGRQYRPPKAREAVLEAQSRHRTLSAREYQVLRMLAEGRTVSEAAADLGISVKTASTYRARMLDKLGMKTNAEVMRYALRHRIVD